MPMSGVLTIGVPASHPLVEWGGQTPMILEVIYEDDLQRSDD